MIIVGLVEVDMAVPALNLKDETHLLRYLNAVESDPAVSPQ